MKFSVQRCETALAGLMRSLDAPVSGYCVGLSGGVDSVVLLHALAGTRRADRVVPVRALHVDHGLYPESGSWAQRCRQLAANYGVECVVLRIDARPAPGESPEAAARAARYAACARALNPREALLTAHHADDQLETVLLQLFRGAGLRGLAAMPRIARMGGGWHLRPLLEFERADLLEWATRANLAWIEDPSNVDPRFDRNYLRHAVLPAVRARWPAAAHTVSRAAAHAAEAAGIEADLAGIDLAAVRVGRTLALDRLDTLSEPRRRGVLRAWLRELGLPPASANTLASLLHDSRAAAADRIPSTRWPGVVVYRYRGHLYAIADTEVARRIGQCRAGETFDLGGGQSLDWQPALGRGLSRARLPAFVEIMRRESGERIQPAGSAHRHSLRKWLQEHSIVPWQRAAIPLVAVERRVVAIADLAYMDEFAARPDEDAWVLAWRGRPPLTPADFQNAHVSGGGRST